MAQNTSEICSANDHINFMNDGKASEIRLSAFTAWVMLTSGPTFAREPVPQGLSMLRSGRVCKHHPNYRPAFL